MKNFNKLARKLVRDWGDTPKKIVGEDCTALEIARITLRPPRRAEIARRRG